MTLNATWRGLKLICKGPTGSKLKKKRKRNKILIERISIFLFCFVRFYLGHSKFANNSVSLLFNNIFWSLQKWSKNFNTRQLLIQQHCPLNKRKKNVKPEFEGT